MPHYTIVFAYTNAETLEMSDNIEEFLAKEVLEAKSLQKYYTLYVDYIIDQKLSYNRDDVKLNASGLNYKKENKESKGFISIKECKAIAEKYSVFEDTKDLEFSTIDVYFPVDDKDYLIGTVAIIRVQSERKILLTCGSEPTDVKTIEKYLDECRN